MHDYSEVYVSVECDQGVSHLFKKRGVIGHVPGAVQKKLEASGVIENIIKLQFECYTRGWLRLGPHMLI